MTGPELARDNETSSWASLPESNFDKLKKKYPDQIDKIQFITTHEKIKDNPEAQEALSQTISTLAQENILDNMNDFWNNIEQVTNNLLQEDRVIDDIAVLEQTGNIYVFRTNFEKIKEIENNEQKTEKFETMRKELANKYDTIDDIYKPKTDIDIKNTKDNHLKEQNILKELNISSDQQTLYFSYLYAIDQIVKEAWKPKENGKIQVSKENYEFIKDFTTLNDTLGIESTINLWDFTIIEDKDINKSDDGENSMNNLTYDKNLAKNLAENNADVEEFIADTETDIFKEDDKESKLSKTVLTEKLGDRYSKDIKEDITKLLKNNTIGEDEEVTYEACFNTNGTLKNLPEELQQYEKQLTAISENIVNKYANQAQKEMLPTTNKVIKSKAVAALVQSIGKFLNVQDVEKQFMINIADGIEFDGEMLTLGGKMEGKDLKFYYDITTGEVRADDFVHYNKEDKTFYVDKGENKNKWRERLPLKMPNLNDAMIASQNAVGNKIDDFLENSNPIKNYENILNEAVVDISKDSAVAEIVIQHTMAKNIALQETQEFLEEYLPNRKEYSRDKRPKEYDLYQIMDTSFDRYTNSEINKRRDLLWKFNEKISKEKPGYKDEMIQGMFDKNLIQKEVEDRYDMEKWPKMYQFIHALTYNQPGTIKNDVIDLDLFEKVVMNLEKTEGTTKNLAKLSPKYKNLRNNYNEEQEKESVDAIIDNNENVRNNPMT